MGMDNYVAAKRIGGYVTDGVTSIYSIPFTKFYLAPSSIYISILMMRQVLGEDYEIEMQAGKPCAIHFNQPPVTNQVMGIYELRPPFSEFIKRNTYPERPVYSELTRSLDNYFEQWVFPQGEIINVCK